jgi:hypothetical protein
MMKPSHYHPEDDDDISYIEDLMRYCEGEEERINCYQYPDPDPQLLPDYHGLFLEGSSNCGEVDIKPPKDARWTLKDHDQYYIESHFKAFSGPDDFDALGFTE